MNISDIINAVNWETISPEKWAREIPLLLNTLVAEKHDNEWEKAFQTLSNHISHQAGIYGTTIATIPVLLRFLELEVIQDKQWVLRLLKTIHFQTPESDDLYMQAYTAMSQGLEVFRPFLHDSDTLSRVFVGTILARFTLHAPMVAGWLEEQIAAEKDEEVKVSLIEDLGTLLNEASVVDENTITQALATVEPLTTVANIYVRREALHSVLKIRKEATSPELIQKLLEVVAGLQGESEEDFDFALDVSITFKYLQTDSFRLELMLMAFAAVSTPPIATIFATSLLAAYGFRKPGKDASLLEEITSDQKRIVDAILQKDVFWDQNLSGIYNTYRITLDRQELKAFAATVKISS